VLAVALTLHPNLNMESHPLVVAIVANHGMVNHLVVIVANLDPVVLAVTPDLVVDLVMARKGLDHGEPIREDLPKGLTEDRLESPL
jgi:hypothetical protein